MKTKIEILIRGIVNIASDCVEDLRPFGQYKPYWRQTRKKISDLLLETSGVCIADPETYHRIGMLSELEVLIGQYDPSTKEGCIDLSNRVLDIIERETGYEATREAAKSKRAARKKN